MKKKIFIIDSHSLIYKAYYAIQNLTDSKGKSTNAVYGFTRMLLKIIDNYSPDYLIAVFDAGKKTFRNEIFPEYKATRQKTPSDLIPQFADVKQILNALKTPVIQLENYEADDIIGTLAEKYRNDFEVFIISGDKDLNQLISDNVKILNSKKGITDIVTIDEKAFIEKYGINLNCFIDYLSLIGDTSDNIPGVVGIGPKTAVKLLNDYQTLENIYNNLENIKQESLREKLRINRENAFLSKRLVTIDKTLNLNFDFHLFDKNNIKFLAAEFERLEFYSLIKELGMATAAPTDSFTSQKNSDSKDALIFELKEISEISDFSAIATAFKNKRNVFVYNALFNKKNTIYFVSENILGYFDACDNKLLEFFYEALIKNGCILCGYDLKQLLKLFIAANFETEKICLFDYRIANGLLNKDESIYTVFLKNFHTEPASIDALEFENIDLFEKAFTDELRNKIIDFFGYYVQLKDKLETKLAETGHKDLFESMELPLIHIVALMEYYGVTLDKEYLEKLAVNVSVKIENISAEIFKEIGETINLNSPKQIADVLYNKIGLTPQRKIKTGYSTDNEALMRLKHFHRAPELILEYRKYIKILTGYIQPLIEHIHKDGKIHCNFNQAGATTGRFSSNNPNLQNLPTSSQDIINIRRAFTVESEKNLLVGLDYSQIELRIIAHLANDEYMINAFNNGEDIHQSTAAKIFKVDSSSVTIDMRRLAKTINFGVLYGMSAHSLANETGLFYNQAKTFIDNYFNQFSSIKKYFDDLIFDAKKNGYVETLFHRRRYIPELLSKNKNIQQSGIRMSINMPVQGTAADILKLAMLKTKNVCEKYGARCIMTIHDELIFETRQTVAVEFSAAVKKIMENVFSLNAPLKVEARSGMRLDELK